MVLEQKNVAAAIRYDSSYLLISMPGKMRTVQWTADQKKMSGAKYILVYSLVSKWGQCTFSLFSSFWHYTVRNMYLYLIDTAILYI